MGNNTNSSPGNGVKNENSLGKEEMEHERLGQISYQEEEGEDDEQRQYMSINVHVESKKAWDDWERDYRKVDDSQTREILLLPEQYNLQTTGMCGFNGIGQLKYEYFEFVLATEIMNRQKIKRQFLQTEIWYLLYNMIRAGNKFEMLRKKIGNVHPTNILINEHGQTKIISTCSFPGQLDNFAKFYITKQWKEVYLAPEEINSAKIENGQYPDVDPCTAEVFSIGLTILVSGTLEDTSLLYLNNPFRFNQQRLAELLKIFSKQYSNYLYLTVSRMLAINPKERKKASQIYRALFEYEKKILELEEFTPEPKQSLRYQQGYQGQGQQQMQPSQQQIPQQMSQQISQQMQHQMAQNYPVPNQKTYMNAYVPPPMQYPAMQNRPVSYGPSYQTIQRQNMPVYHATHHL